MGLAKRRVIFTSLPVPYAVNSQLVSVLRYAKEQPQLLESQGNGQFSGSTEQGVSFVITARNKGTVESITVDRYQIKFL